LNKSWWSNMVFFYNKKSSDNLMPITKCVIHGKSHHSRHNMKWCGGGKNIFLKIFLEIHISHIYCWFGMSFFIIRFLERTLHICVIYNDTNEFTRFGGWFWLSTLPSSLSYGGNLDVWIWILLLSNYNLFHHCCDMDELYGTTKKPHQYLSSMISFNNG
jgi:hypothetical protein